MEVDAASLSVDSTAALTASPLTAEQQQRLRDTVKRLHKVRKVYEDVCLRVQAVVQERTMAEAAARHGHVRR